MTDLYYRPHLREAPALLPFSAQTPDGEWRTDLANHPESVVECGFVLAPPRPDDTETQTAEWDGSAEAWVMVDRPPAPPEPVPEFVTMRQAKLQLSRAKILPQANAIIAAIEGQAGEEARIEWESATTLRRDHPLVAALGARLGLDDAAKDDLFRQAAGIL